MTKQVVSHYSEISGTDVRHVYDASGKTLLGTIFKIGRGKYRVLRIDGKSRVKDSLADAFKTVRRAN